MFLVLAPFDEYLFQIPVCSYVLKKIFLYHTAMKYILL